MKLAVFCGSRYGKEEKYKKLAEQVGEYIADVGAELVYGGSISGLMGAVSDGVIKKNGSVTGIYPRGLFADEVPREDITEFIFTDTLDERKQLLINKSDAYLVLPGGLGTLEELSQVLSAGSIGLIPAKPVAILDIDGFYHSFIEFLINASNEAFIDPEATKHLLISADYHSLIDKICCEVAGEGVVAS
ncbi:TIGR00730 family Rossman fold protein [Enterococcus gilvus]|uniref:LOG family protein n=1 Tax=Enterococcus gilvus TaxID=160453 RepID=UPI003D6A1926